MRSAIHVFGLGVLSGLLFLFASCATGPEPGPPPEVHITTEGPVFISPESSEGVQDTLEADLSVVTQLDIGVRSISARISDDAGNTVRSYEKSAPGEEQTVEPFERIVWDGRNEDVDYVTQGKFTLRVRVVDELGRSAESDELIVVVDNEAPEIRVSTPYTTFSPDGDGNKDVFYVQQEGSVVESWTGEILDGSRDVVRSYSWNNTAPPRVAWEGENDAGEAVADGTYTYRVIGRDSAGNTSEARIDSISLDTTDYQVSLGRDLGAFSPNGDGRKDSLTLSASIPDRGGAVTQWAFTVRREDDSSVFSREGEGAPPRQFTYEGETRNGRTAAEGSYVAALRLVFQNGDRAEAVTEPFTLDVTAPEVSASANFEIFSPNGDGNKERVTLRQSSSGADSWSAALVNADGAQVREYSWQNNLPDSLTWAGEGGDGSELPDGRYRYRVVASDAAGNSSRAETSRFIKDTSEVPAVALKPQSLAFSPNGDERKDLLSLAPEAATTEGLVTHRLSIRDSDGATLYSEEGTGQLPAEFSWNGRTNAGEPAPEGEYVAHLKLTYENGNAPTVTTEAFRVDRTAPAVNVDAEYTLFSPDGDGNRDSLTFSQSSSAEHEWRAEIVNESGETVYSESWTGEVQDVTWSGTNNEGAQVSDGSYTYRVQAEDRAGNRLEKRLTGITIDTRQPSTAVSAGAPGLSPNGDGRNDQITLELFTSIREGIQAWALEIRGPDGSTVRRYTSGDEQDTVELPESRTWFGKNEDGDVVRSAPYTAHLSVKYRKGNEPTATTESPIVVDTRAPTVDPTVSPTPFSPDGDGVDDRVRIALGVEDNTGVAQWRITVLDPAGNTFTQFSGQGVPEDPITWDGRSSDGERVEAAEDYTARIRVRDTFGNEARSSVTIPVDILVTEEDGDLRIRITSIQFVPFEADYRNLEDEDEVEQNLQTLDRLAEVLKKYPDHQIRVEGHAVQIYHYDEELAQEEQEETLVPLSRERAEAIKQALVERGVAAERMTTVGRGGAEPVVPHGNLENRWKNRRVEFELIRNDAS